LKTKILGDKFFKKATSNQETAEYKKQFYPIKTAHIDYFGKPTRTWGINP
jgi:hypothetical protein